jgi:phosphoribosylformylglycinamidine synthase
LKSRWLNHLKKLPVASQKGLAERFCSTIGAGTVLYPFGGRHRLTPSQVMAAKIPTGNDTETVSLMAYGFDPYTSEANPFNGAVLAVTESLAKIVAVGGSYKNARLTFQEYFEKLGEDPERWQKPFLSLLGGFWAQMEFETPAIGGKDSMSGSYGEKDVPPTLVSFAVQTGKAAGVYSQEFKQAGHKLVWLRARYDEAGLPDFGYLKESFTRVNELFAAGKLHAAYALNANGVAAALTQMALGNGIGVEINTGVGGTCDKSALEVGIDTLTSASALFNAEIGSFLLECDCCIEAALTGLEYVVLGETVAEPVITVNGERIDLADCRSAWLSKLEPVFPTGQMQEYTDGDIRVPLYNADKLRNADKLHNTDKPAASAARGNAGENVLSLQPCEEPAASTARINTGIAKPRVFIPVFPGTNCEYDTARVFEKAGAVVETLVIRNLTLKDLNESLAEMERRIRGAQIIMLAGGFSAGDEPDGSAKFITAMFHNPRIIEATHELLNGRDGLMLGICNGFQALVKTGLLPYGEIKPMADDAPTLTYNKIGRHVSDLIVTKVISHKSPWLAGVAAGDMHRIPVSHGEGRFVASEQDIRRMISQNQIATQYVDFDGNPSMDIRYNPNGSMWAIEGITSPDGRIFGKMGHSERFGSGLYKGFDDLPTDQRLFESGVKYFS